MTAGVPVGGPPPELDSYVHKGEALKASKREAEPKMSFLTLCAELRSQEEYLVARRQVDAG